MLKIVPDPPYSPATLHTLDDLLLELAEYLFCARALANQNASIGFKSHAHGLALATIHEIEAASAIAELALSKIQVRH